MVGDDDKLNPGMVSFRPSLDDLTAIDLHRIHPFHEDERCHQHLLSHVYTTVVADSPRE
jgi:hypothetical protein